MCYYFYILILCISDFLSFSLIRWANIFLFPTIFKRPSYLWINSFSIFWHSLLFMFSVNFYFLIQFLYSPIFKKLFELIAYYIRLFILLRMWTTAVAADFQSSFQISLPPCPGRLTVRSTVRDSHNEGFLRCQAHG